MLWLALSAVLPQGAPADTVIAKATAATTALADTAAARMAGFVPLALGRVQDLSPFQGQHWIHRGRVMGDARQPEAPSFAMFIPVAGAWQAVGVAYSSRIGHDQPVPTDLDGLTTPWHLHQMCLGVPGEGPTLADGVDDCRARGGTPTPRQIAMVHAWTASPNPQGSYAHDNVALPYLATGVTPPTAAEMATADAVRRVRALGLALGETYGARMAYARRVETLNEDSQLAEQLASHRAVLTELVPGIIEERSTPGPTPGPAERRAVAEWEAIQELYRRMAPTQQVRAQLDRQHATALGDRHHH